MKIYPKTFVNPLLAIAFKEGIDFIGDPDYKALEPKREGNKWVVIVEHEDDDDDDDVLAESVKNNVIIMEPTEPVKKQATFHDYEDRLKKMQPITAKSAPTPGEVIHPPVKITAEEPELPDPPSTRRGCGQCIPCAQGQDCLQVINEALASMPVARER